MAEVADLETAILRELVRIGPCAFDDLALALCEYSWNQVFAAVDRLSRHGRLALRHRADSALWSRSEGRRDVA